MTCSTVSRLEKVVCVGTEPLVASGYMISAACTWPERKMCARVAAALKMGSYSARKRCASPEPSSHQNLLEQSRGKWLNAKTMGVVLRSTAARSPTIHECCAEPAAHGWSMSKAIKCTRP